MHIVSVAVIVTRKIISISVNATVKLIDLFIYRWVFLFNDKSHRLKSAETLSCIIQGWVSYFLKRTSYRYITKKSNLLLISLPVQNITFSKLILQIK